MSAFIFMFARFCSLVKTKNAARLPASTSLLVLRQFSASRVSYLKRFVLLKNLPYNVQSEAIEALAEKFSPLSINIPKNDSGLTTGIANVEFANAEDAKSFYDSARDSPSYFEGRSVRFDLSHRAYTERASRGTRTPHPPSTTIFIGRLNRDTQRSDIEELFRPFGNILRITIDAGPIRGFAHVEYETIQQASDAMEGLLNDGQQPVLAGKNISLDFAPLGSAAASNTLFISNYNGTEADFRLALSSLAQNVTEVRFGPNRAFVEFPTIVDAINAKASLGSYRTPDGHSLNVWFARTGRSRPLAVNDAASPPTGSEHTLDMPFEEGFTPCNTVFIGRLNPATTDYDIEEVMGPYGTITRITIGENRGFAHVEYRTVEEATAAVKALLGSSQAPVLAGKNVTIGFAQTNLRDEPSNTLFLSRFQGDRADIRDAFAPFEHEVTKLKFVDSGAGFITLRTVEAAMAAKEALNKKSSPGGHLITLWYAHSPNKILKARSKK